MTSDSAAKEGHTPETDVLAIDERHDTVAETRYWCNQYKQHARILEADRARLRERVGELEKMLQECLELSDNWPGIAYSYELEGRIKAALSKSPK